MLTSKEVLERTGISRATLNNYIGSGIVPRPEVLPPQPSDGTAPRIGYFPVAIVERIEAIQRLKREGWSITRITEHFAGAGRAASPAASMIEPQLRAPALRAASDDRSMPSLSFGELVHPAYLVNSRFELVWANAGAGSAAWPNHVLVPSSAVSQPVLRHVLGQPGDGIHARSDPRNAILRLHLGMAKQRGTTAADLCRGMAPAQVELVERLYREMEPFEFPLVVRAPVVAGPPGNARMCFLYALNFREGILFVFVPASGATEEVSGLLSQPGPVEVDPARAVAPAFGPLAILAMDLQDASRLWSELPAQEYFELMDQVRAAVEPILQRHHGVPGKHPGEGMVCHFFPQPDSSYLWNAIVAAHEVREALRGVSKEWQLRKNWAAGLCLNSGIDEGHAWHRTPGAGPQADSTVHGDVARHAMQISAIGRSGAIWASRNLMDKLTDAERGQLEYGVRRSDPEGRHVRVASVFSRVEDLDHAASGEGAGLKAIGMLAVTEIFGLAMASRAPHSGLQ